MKYLLPQHTRHKCTFPNIIPHLIYNSFFINSESAVVMPFNNLIFKLNHSVLSSRNSFVISTVLLSTDGWLSSSELKYDIMNSVEKWFNVSSMCLLHTEARLDDLLPCVNSYIQVTWDSLDRSQVNEKSHLFLHVRPLDKSINNVFTSIQWWS